MLRWNPNIRSLLVKSPGLRKRTPKRERWVSFVDNSSKDIINSMKFLNKDGIIILHDMLPRSKTEETQEYSGDVWKVAVDLSKSKNIEFVIANIDQGVGLVKINENSNYRGSRFYRL